MCMLQVCPATWLVTDHGSWQYAGGAPQQGSQRMARSFASSKRLGSDIGIDDISGAAGADSSAGIL